MPEHIADRPWLTEPAQALARSLAADRLPHALLVHGARGIGKRALVEHFVAAVLCREPDAESRPCGACRGCRFAAAGTHPDQHRIGLEEDSRQLKVDQVRELARKASLTSSEGGYQVFVLDPADRLNVNAANALLKTLEEPRAATLMVLVAESIAALPVTVLSRCQQVAVRDPSREEALAWLQARRPGDDGAQRALALTAAAGRPGEALQLLEAGAVGQFRETMNELVALAGGQADPVAVAARWVPDSGAPAERADAARQRLRWMSRALRQAAWRRARGSGTADSLTGRLDLVSLTALARATDRATAQLETNLRPEQVVETLLMDWAAGAVRNGGGWSW